MQSLATVHLTPIFDRANFAVDKVLRYAGQSQLDAKIVNSLNSENIFDLHRSPSRQATINDMDFMFPVPSLPSLTWHRCKYEGMDMHNLATVLCQI